MEDLRTKFKMPNPQGWKTLVRVALKNVLWKHVRLIASHFYHFAGVDARRMSEVQFWRFVEETQVAAEPLAPLVAMQIFDAVVSPQIASIWRVAGKDEKREKMLEAVQEQIEIRFLKPNQFTEILVRFAVARYKGGIIEATENFLSELRLPVMERILPVTLLFYEPESQRVMSYFQHDLARVFFFYMNHQLNESLKGRSQKMQGCGTFHGTSLLYDLHKDVCRLRFYSSGAGWRVRQRWLPAKDTLYVYRRGIENVRGRAKTHSIDFSRRTVLFTLLGDVWRGLHVLVAGSSCAYHANLPHSFLVLWRSYARCLRVTC
ncbi:hypothetical protein C3747_131g62 [Trypanosoma cruzi]|uniref:Uncharacterized protein n=1 Tax=Trypanosoma cruzi TaxID=5693 RepID=A0A2V2WCW2_TRYCR|nr:hypothetical protein C3747_131g62 [Trypanosoma cruzi]